MSNLKYKLEALLFSSARTMTIDELSTLTKSLPEDVKKTIEELKEDYNKRDSSISLIDEGDKVKLNVKPEHLHVIQQIVTETELSKTLMETLAVIAFKYPIKQSDLIKLRTNKAYDHLRELEEIGYIIRQKFGRTKLIKLTPKFFEYFDLPPEKLKEKFENFEGIAKAIKEKEGEIKKTKDEIVRKAKAEGEKTKQEKSNLGPEIDLIDEAGHKKKLDVFEATEQEVEQEESKEVKPYADQVGNLEITDVPEKEEPPEEEGEEPEEEVEGIPLTEEMGEDVIDEIKEMVNPEEEKQKTPGQVESEVDKQVDNLLNPKEESEELQKQTDEQGDADQGLSQEKTSNDDEEDSEVDKKVEEMLNPKEEPEEDSEETNQEPSEETSKQSLDGSEKPDSEEPKDLLEAAAEEENNPDQEKKDQKSRDLLAESEEQK